MIENNLRSFVRLFLYPLGRDSGVATPKVIAIPVCQIANKQRTAEFSRRLSIGKGITKYAPRLSAPPIMTIHVVFIFVTGSTNERKDKSNKKVPSIALATSINGIGKIIVRAAVV